MVLLIDTMFVRTTVSTLAWIDELAQQYRCASGVIVT